VRAVLAALLLVATALCAQVAIPELRERVTDTTGTLTAADKAQLEAPLAALEAQKGAQIAILVVPSTGAETIEQYAVRAFEQWKLGRAGVDDGVLLVVAKDDRTVRIEVGYGLEGAIPDVSAHRIIQEYLVPRFRSGDFAGGLQAAVGALATLVQGEALPAPMSSHPAGSTRVPGLDEGLPLIFMLGMLGIVIRRFIGGMPVLMRLLVMPAALFVLAKFWMGSSFVLAAVAAGLGLVIALMPAISGGFANGGRSGGWSGGRGGRWGGGGGSGGVGFGGGGGFSGGGGRSGGGGASGRW